MKKSSELLKNKIQTILDEKLQNEILRVQEKIEIVKGLGHIGIFDGVGICDNNKFDELNDYLFEESKINKKLREIDAKLEVIEQEMLQDLKKCLATMQEIQRKKGRKRGTKITCNGKEKYVSVSEKYYNNYISLLVQVDFYEKLMACIKDRLKDPCEDIFKIDDALVKTLSNKEKITYFDILGTLMLLEGQGEKVLVKANRDYYVSASNALEFEKCFLEYKKAARKEKFSLSRIASNLSSRLTKKKNRVFPAYGRLAVISLIIGIFGGDAVARYYDSLRSERAECIKRIEQELLAFEESLESGNNPNSIARAKVNLDDIMPLSNDIASSSLEVVDYGTNVASLNVSDNTDFMVTNTTFVNVNTDMGIVGSEDETFVFSDPELEELRVRSEEMGVSNDEISRGLHLTFNNTTYPVSKEDFLKVYDVVAHECNGTYSDALGVISIILNRIEDGRYDVENVIDVVSALGQFEVWNAARAEAFANSNPELKEPIYNAMYDAIYRGIRVNDYVEFKASWTSDYTSRGERKVQIVEDGNKYHNLAHNLDRVNNDDEAQEELENSSESAKPLSLVKSEYITVE